MNHPELIVERVRHELKLRQLTVARVERIAGLIIRVTLSGDDLHDFVTASFDDHVKIFFPEHPGGPMAQPVLGSNGLSFPEDQPRPLARDYTPRRFDRERRELVIDFILHDDGPASNWAAQAQAGQTLFIGGPRGSFVVPTGFDWHVLIGDETALPAIGRRLEELPEQTRAIVRIEVAQAANEIPLASKAKLDLQWLHRNGVPAGASTLLPEAAARLALPEGEGYVWVAAESAAAQAVREVMVTQHQIGKRRIRASSYWKRGASGVHETLE